MALEIDTAESNPRNDKKARRISRSIENLMAESPKKGSPYCYDRIHAWIVNNKSTNRAMYLSTLLRRSNLSLLETTWVWGVLSRKQCHAETSVLLDMLGYVRNAVQTYHDIARAHGLSLSSARDPSQMIINPNSFPDALDAAMEQFRIIFNVEENTREVAVCMQILQDLLLFAHVRAENPRELANHFSLCLLISLRGENPQMFRNASNIRSHVWSLAVELLNHYEKTIEDQPILFSPGTIPTTLRV